MKLAIMQPYVFPYIGYFQLIKAVDKFVFYDDVHFIKKGWIHRNNILINGEANLFTIPCKKISQNKLINEVALNFDKKEKEKFLKKIAFAYKKAPYFSQFYPLLENFINKDTSYTISELASNSILFICEYLGINRDFCKSSIKHSESKGLEKQERLITICKKENANTYLNAIGGKELYNKNDFKKESIELKFIKPGSVVYTQFKNKFIPNLSIIDVIMFNTPEIILEIIDCYKFI